MLSYSASSIRGCVALIGHKIFDLLNKLTVTGRPPALKLGSDHHTRDPRRGHRPNAFSLGSMTAVFMA